MQHSFHLEEGLFRRVQNNAELLKLTPSEALAQVLTEWCDNREYLRGEVGQKRFPGAARSLKSPFVDHDIEGTKNKGK